MRLQLVAVRRWTIVAMCDNRGNCPVVDFLDTLETDSKADFRQVMTLVRRTAAVGPPMNTGKSRPLDEEIYELKTRRGIRIPYFYDEGRVIICTEALRRPKKTELVAVIRRAVEQRAQYFRAKLNGELKVTEGEA